LQKIQCTKDTKYLNFGKHKNNETVNMHGSLQPVSSRNEVIVFSP